MVKFQKESLLFDETKGKEEADCEKKPSLLKRIGGRKGLMLASFILNNPKYKGLI
jgi:hypothetical protein